MIDAAIQLVGGGALQKRRGSWILQPDGLTVEVHLEGDVATITEPDTGKATQRRVAGPDAGPRAPKRSKQEGGQGRPARGPGPCRWQAYNEFVDLVGPTLTLAEREVWHVMFRHARNGTVETTARTLATACKVDKGTVARALRKLETLRLIWPVWKSLNRHQPSKYGMAPSPASCLGGIMKTQKPR